MPTLFYIHDPMCSWCYGFKPVLKQLLAGLPENIKVKRVLGGLAADSDKPMPAEMQGRLQATWTRISEKIPGTEFNFSFWTDCKPRRSTYPACRAVIAAREQDQQYDEIMTEAIQFAYYRQARNPSDDSTLVELAKEIGLDEKCFTNVLNARQTEQTLQAEIAQATVLGMEGMPSLVLETGPSRWFIPVDYTDASAMLETINVLLED